MRTNRRGLRAGLLATVAVLLTGVALCGCGSKDSGSAPDAPPPSDGEVPPPANQPTVTLGAASLSTLTAGSAQVATITATVLAANGSAAPAGTAVAFTVGSATVAEIVAADATTTNGAATVTIRGLKSGTALVTAKALGVTSKGVSVTVAAPRVVLSLVDPTQTTIPASDLGAGGAAVRISVTDSASQPMKDVDVAVTTTLGTLVPDLVRTDEGGQGEVTLTSQVVGPANLKASAAELGAQSGIFTITVAAAPLARVLLAPTPSQIPPDGSTASQISVQAKDAFGNPVDGTVSLASRDKTTGDPLGLLSPASVLLVGGVAGSSSLTSDRVGTGAVTVEATMTDPRYPGTTVHGTTDVVLVATAEGEPASIRLAANPAIVSVWGVGQNAVSTVSIEVLDSSGLPIVEGPGCSNNLEVAISGGPSAGENLQGRTQGQTLILTTKAGKAAATFNSGTRPGTVAFAVSVTKNAAGGLLETPITAEFPILTIASGPPFSVTLAEGFVVSSDPANTHVILPIVALVEDVWGNAVPDGTPVSFGLVYNVTYSGSDGVVAAGGSDFVSAAAAFDPANISTEPPIDTLVIEDGNSVGGYFLAAVADATTLQVTSTFPKTDSAIRYVVGNSKGGPVLEGGTAVKNGVALINLRYPVALAALGMPPVYLYAETSDRQLGAVRKMPTPWLIP